MRKARGFSHAFILILAQNTFSHLRQVLLGAKTTSTILSSPAPFYKPDLRPMTTTLPPAASPLTACPQASISPRRRSIMSVRR